MFKKSNSGLSMESVFVLFVFCMFAASVFLVLTFSADAFQNMEEVSARGRDEQIALSYIRTRTRSVDSARYSTITYFNDLPALSIEEVISGGRVFITHIYLYDGWIRELFHEQGREFLPGDGVPIIRAERLDFEEINERLFRVITDYGSMLISKRSGVFSLD